jgi:hypothetical protein
MSSLLTHLIGHNIEGHMNNQSMTTTVAKAEMESTTGDEEGLLHEQAEAHLVAPFAFVKSS